MAQRVRTRASRRYALHAIREALENWSTRRWVRPYLLEPVAKLVDDSNQEVRAAALMVLWHHFAAAGGEGLQQAQDEGTA